MGQTRNFAEIKPDRYTAPEPAIAPAPGERHERNEEERCVPRRECAERRRRDEGDCVAPGITHSQCPERQRETCTEDSDPERQAKPPRQNCERCDKEHEQGRVERRVSDLNLGCDRSRIGRAALADRDATFPDRAGEVEADGVVVHGRANAHVHPDEGGGREDDEHRIAPRPREPVRAHTRLRPHLADYSIRMSGHCHENRSRARRTTPAEAPIGTI